MRSKLGMLWKLFATFFKIGLFTFGGGYAMIALIQQEVAERKGWISEDDLLEIIAVSESTPGPIAINSATFIGYRMAGFWGSFAATLGVVLPSFGIILAVSYVLRRFYDLEAVRYAFFGIRAGVLALIFKAIVSMYKQCPKGIVSYLLMAAALIAAAFLKINVLFIIIGCAVIGLVSSLLASKKAGKTDTEVK